MSFTSFNLDPRVAAGVTACGYTTPTPIQKHSIPPAMQGRDIMGLAQTGTGKTAAFALPILHRLLDGPRGVLRALVLAPTRELAEQIRTSFEQLAKSTKLKTTTIYGGVSIGPQQRSLRNGVDVVVACPGRLLDHMRQRSIDLSRIETLVLDEADMMLDMGFLPDVRRIIAGLPAKRQNMMFSATMPEPIRELAGEILREPATFRVPHSKPIETVAHALYPVQQQQKTAMLLHLLNQTDTGSVLIFTRTKHRAKRVAAQLVAAGFNATSLQGNLSQNARQAALGGFRKGTFDIMVATDIAARGIDIAEVSHVINYDMPDTTDAYTHRIGRTGRATRTGDAFTLTAPEDEPLVRANERVLGSPIERRKVDGAVLPDVAGIPSPRGEGRNQRGRSVAASRGERSTRAGREPRAARTAGAGSDDRTRKTEASGARKPRSRRGDAEQRSATPAPKARPATKQKQAKPAAPKSAGRQRASGKPATGSRRSFDDRFERDTVRTAPRGVDPLSSSFIRSARLVEDVVAPSRPYGRKSEPSRSGRNTPGRDAGGKGNAPRARRNGSANGGGRGPRRKSTGKAG